MGVVGQSRFGFQSWPCREVLQSPCKQAGKRSELLIYETLLDHIRKFSSVANSSNSSSKPVTCFCWSVRVQAVVGKPGETTRVHGSLQQCSDLCMLAVSSFLSPPPFMDWDMDASVTWSFIAESLRELGGFA